MSPQDLASELRKKPFQPFRIVATDGKSYDVTERDIPMLWVGETIVLFGFRVSETSPFFNRYEAVSLAHIVRLEPLPLSHQKAS